MSKTTSSSLPHNLMGFVSDPVSEKIINNVIKEQNMAYSEVMLDGTNDIIEFLKENRTPKILIVDLSDSELPLSDIIRIKDHSTPNINIITIGNRNDVGLFRDLMQAGVIDYLVKPLNNVILKRALDKANGVPTEILESKTGKMIYCVSSVGGAGCSTAATNISWILANRHFKRTALIDMDFAFGTANMLLDLKAENAYLDILESSDKIDEYFIETILKKHGTRLYYLGGLINLARGIEHVDSKAFAALIDIMKKQFNYLIVDGHRELNHLNKICINKSNSYVIMAEMSVASAQNTARFLEYLTIENATKKSLIVANKTGFSSRGAISREAFERVISRPIDYVLPVDEVITLAAANIGRPLAASESSVTTVLEDISEDILGKKENNKLLEAIENQAGMSIDQIKERIFDVINDISKKLGGLT